MAVRYGQLAIPDVATFKSANNIASTDSNGKLVLAQSPLTAGENITISSQGVISSTGGGSKFELIKEDINVNNRTAEVRINPANAAEKGGNSQSIRLTTAETNKGTITLLASALSIGPELNLSSNNYTNTVTLTTGNTNRIAFNIETYQQESVRSLSIGEYVKVASEVSAFNRYNQNESSWMFTADSSGKELSVANQFTTSIFDSYSGSNAPVSLAHVFKPIHGYGSGTPETTDIFGTSEEKPYRSLAEARMEIEWPSVNFHTNNSIDINNYNSRRLTKGGLTFPNIMKIHGYYVARIYGRDESGATIPYDGKSKYARLYLAYSLPLTSTGEIDLDKIWNQDPTDLPDDFVDAETLREFANQNTDGSPLDSSIANQYSFYSAFHYPYCFSINSTKGNSYIDVVVNSDLDVLYDSNIKDPFPPHPFKKPGSTSYYVWRFACFPADPRWDMYKKGYDYQSIEFTINSFALGFDHQATGFMAFTTGRGNKVLDSYSGAFGVKNTVAGYGSFTLGSYNTIVGESSNVNGNRNTVKGASLYAIGLRNQITGCPLVSTDVDGSLGGSVVVGFANTITLSGDYGRKNYGQSYCFGTKLSTTKPNQLILGWANEEVTGSSDTNHQIIFGVGDFNGSTVTKRNAMVMDATGIDVKLPIKSGITVDSVNINSSNISGNNNNVGTGCIAVGKNNTVARARVAIGLNNQSSTTEGAYGLLVGNSNINNHDNVAVLGKFLKSGDNHQIVLGLNNSQVTGAGLVVGVGGNTSANTGSLNGLQVTAQGLKVPVYASKTATTPISTDTGVKYMTIRIIQNGVAPNVTYTVEACSV